MEEIIELLGEPRTALPKAKVVDDCDYLADVDQAALFDELEDLCNPPIPVSQSAVFAELEMLCADDGRPAPVPVAVQATTVKGAGRQARVEGGAMF